MKTIEELKNLPDVPVVISDRDGRVVHVNACFLEAYQWTEQLIGQSLTRIIPSHFHDSHNLGFSRFLVTGVSRIAGHVIEAPVVMGNGGQRWSRHLISVEVSGGEVFIGARLAPMDAPPEAADATHSGEEADHAPRTIDELRGTMGKMEAALAEVDDAIAWIDATGRVHWCNRAFDRLVGRAHLSIMGADLSELLPGVSGRRLAGPHADAECNLADGEPRRMEFEARVNGSREVLEVNCAGFTLKGSRRYVILVLRVVTRQRRMAEALAESRRRMARELEIGRDIQMSLLPAAAPTSPSFSIHGLTRPALEVGGDFFDHYFIRNHRLLFCVGDVSGKGVPAALFMAVTQTMIRDHAAGLRSAAEIARSVNREIHAHNRSDMFISLFIGILDTLTGELTFTNAGHNPPLFRPHNGAVRLLDARHGPVVGVSDLSEYEEETLYLSPGDGLLVYTDGVTEAVNPAGEPYSLARLQGLLERLDCGAPAEMVETLADDVKAFRGDAPRHDDVTLMCLRFNGAALDFQI